MEASPIVKTIREMEQSVIGDVKNVNTIVHVAKFLENKSHEVRMAAIHSLRRIFVHVLDEKRMSAKQLGPQSDKLKEYKAWISHQLKLFQGSLCEVVVSPDDAKSQIVAVRTMLEFVKREHIIRNVTQKRFGVETFSLLLDSLVRSNEIDIDTLLMMREEMFSKPDCSFYSLVSIRNHLEELKDQSRGPVASRQGSRTNTSKDGVDLVRNCMELLRVIPAVVEDEEVDPGAFMVPVSTADEGDGADSDDADDGDSDSVDSADEEEEAARAMKATSTTSGGKRKHPTLAVASLRLKPSTTSTTKRSKRSSRLGLGAQALHAPSHRKAFAKAWLALLAMPQLTLAQHKTLLKHISDHVLKHLPNPLLMADYLTQCYDCGGIVAILALESLFQLIVRHNLDHPHFFRSLYRLCNAEVLSAKYRGKYMRLLSASLRSTNLPVHVVAAFVKRLATLALHVPSPCALFCVAQATWLLREHQQSLVLLHRNALPSGDEDVTAADRGDDVRQGGERGRGGINYCALDDEEVLEKSGALDSSLWELLALREHHLPGVNALATALESPASTAGGVNAPALAVDDFVEHSFADLIEADLARVKKGAALAFVLPEALLPKDEIISKCFGF